MSEGESETAVGDPGNEIGAFPDAIAFGASNGPHVPAKVSFTITWSPGSDPKHLQAHDTTNGFGGDFTQGVATASWSASEEGFTFTSTPGETSKTVTAYAGTEQNGRFFTH